MQQDLLKLASEVSSVTGEKVDLIDSVMRQTRLLAINARIEAARAGTSGAAFAVVAQEMGAVADDISQISKDLRGAVEANVRAWEKISADLVTDFRGTRFADLALNAIEIIDRNLYERSCDVRWWATDAAVVEALEARGPETSTFAASRLLTILGTYTVYLDLWIADASGRVVANGRPDVYPGVAGLNVAGSDWFSGAMATRSGEDFVVADVQANPALGGAAVATYAAAIRRGGRQDGPPIGVLGIFFDWRPQAMAVVNGVGLTADERAKTRVMLVDGGHRLIASSDDVGVLRETYPLETNGRKSGYYIKGDTLTAFALTPGYETYAGLGWYGVIEAKLR